MKGLALLLLIVSASPMSSLSATVSVTINTAAPGVSLSPCLEANRFGPADLFPNSSGGYFYVGTNTQLVTLFTNAGISLISIGGAPGTDGGQPSTNDYAKFFSFAQAARLQVNILVGTSNIQDNAGTLAYTNIDETNVLFMMQNYSNNLLWISIGNEEDARSGAYTTSLTGFTEYWSYWRTYRDDITSYLRANGAAVPYFGGLDDVIGSYDWPEYFASTNRSVYGANDDILDLTIHYEPYTHGNGDTMFQDATNMLSSNTDDKYFPENETLLNYANDNGYHSSFTEFNAYNGSGQATNNTVNGYANALFGLDALHWWGQAGLFSLNFLDGTTTFFYNNSSNGNLEAAALLYGCAAYYVGGSHGYAEPTTITGANNVNLAAYAVGLYTGDGTGTCTNLYVTLINKSMSTWATNATVIIAPGGFAAGNVAVMYLVQSNGDVTATNGIMLGNADLNGGGPFQPQWTALGSLTNGQCAVSVPATSAAIVRIQAIAVTPPTIVTNLPPQVLLELGETYQYSIAIEGASPLSYQWYQGETPLAGQTNATYTVTASSPGSSTYSVAVTNIYGATNSSISTLTVFSPPTNIVFSVTGNQLTLSWPAGYKGWALQAQTNSLSAGIGTNWIDVSGSSLTNEVIIPINLTNGSVFYRLAYP